MNTGCAGFWYLSEESSVALAEETRAVPLYLTIPVEVEKDEAFVPPAEIVRGTLRVAVPEVTEKYVGSNSATPLLAVEALATEIVIALEAVLVVATPDVESPRRFTLLAIGTIGAPEDGVICSMSLDAPLYPTHVPDVVVFFTSVHTVFPAVLIQISPGI
jgi:hypothetical protein